MLFFKMMNVSWTNKAKDILFVPGFSYRRQIFYMNYVEKETCLNLRAPLTDVV